jgi:hypothetical protein
VVLDDNEMTIIPNMSVFPPCIQVVSFRRNNISALVGSPFASASTDTEFMIADLSENAITSVPSGFFAANLYRM